MNLRIGLVLVAMVLVLAVPFALKPTEDTLAAGDDTLVIITPHNEAIRHEFTLAFSKYYKQKTGRTISLDWRMIGGTSEIARYLKGEYFSTFGNAWRKSGKEWSAEVQGAFDNPSVEPAADPGADTPAQAARRAFLDSPIGIGIDLFFGGGAFDYGAQAKAGRLVDCGIFERHPEWFNDEIFPQQVSGEEFYDKQGRWFGIAVAAFGMCYNKDVLARLGIEVPSAWSDLGKVELFKSVALADPTKSGSAAKAYEMIIQQQMQIANAAETSDTEAAKLALGWQEGLKIILAASANARYFTDAASVVPIDVSLGNAGVGMCIDFYGRRQSEAVQQGDAPSRLGYVTPPGGSAVSVDPIGLLRGAPHRKIAEMFIDYALSPEGQKLWNYKVGAPGGPTRYAIRRLPVRKDLYSPDTAHLRSDPTVMPYEDAKGFTYQSKWTSPLFKVISFIIRVSCLDPHDEQSAAWAALIKANFPPQATAKFFELDAVSYEVAQNEIKPTLAGSDRILEVQMAKKISKQFRTQYHQAEALAKQGK